MLKRFRTRLHGRRGQGMVEFALVIPLLLLIMLIIVELGHLLFFYGSVYAAAREASRYGAAVDDSSGETKYLDVAGMQAAAQRVSFIVGLNPDEDIDISYDCGFGQTPTPSPLTVNPMVGPCPDGGELRVSVHVEAPYSPIVPFPRLPDDFRIGSTVKRTVLRNVGMEGNYPTSVAPTATTAPNCDNIVVRDFGQYKSYPLWHMIKFEITGSYPVTMNYLQVVTKINKADLLKVYLDPVLAENQDPDTLGDLNSIWLGVKNPKNPVTIGLGGALLNSTGHVFLLKFAQPDYITEVKFNTWCGDDPVPTLAIMNTSGTTPTPTPSSTPAP